MFDLQVAQTKQKLAEIINTSGLPATILYYVLDDLRTQAQTLLNKTIQDQANQEAQLAKAKEEAERQNALNSQPQPVPTSQDMPAQASSVPAVRALPANVPTLEPAPKPKKPQ